MNPASPDDVLAQRIASLRELVDERDRRYEDRFRAMDEKTTLALASSEKAVTKAETATEKRFDSVNEFRGSLKDQAATLLPRNEADTRFKAMEEKLEGQAKVIGGLSESRSEKEGSSKTYILIVGFAIGLLAILLKFWK
jgi:hypothetical protein